jgi:glycosyltransferase involved in cell wall biosynthesis
LASKLTGSFTVQTIHGIIPEEGILNHFKARKYISVSEEGEKYLLDNKISGRENIFFINQGFELTGPLIKKKGDITQIICASRLVMEKGVDLFIRAAKIVKDNSDTEPSFFIAGTGEYETQLKELNKEINAGVTFLGRTTSMTEVLKDMDIFVMPTRSSSEGFPMTIVEAAFTGNLIIMSEFGNFKNIFKNNEDGYTFKINDHIELADKILLALKHHDRSAELAERFMNKSEILFNLKTVVRKHTEVYKSCLKL